MALLPLSLAATASGAAQHFQSAYVSQLTMVCAECFTSLNLLEESGCRHFGGLSRDFGLPWFSDHILLSLKEYPVLKSWKETRPCESAPSPLQLS